MNFNDFNNPQVSRLPNHLKQYIVEQHYEKYTPVDHAVWRYVMRQNYSYLKDVAYYPYIPGLEKAGLTIEKIPDLQEMNDALGKIGWGAVTVDGFIPPAAFMEYQAYRVLVIAADIRQLHHIQYTPAPDIIHESAGHAPIIADADYHHYLSYFGSIGAKAMFSSKDFKLYEAIRELSILKELPGTPAAEIEIAEAKVKRCQEDLGEPSEMALLSRLHWWTVEYGLIGTLDNPKIYGAGLLSSIGESASCMKPEVEKLWYTIDAVNYPFDITKEQPQLFVTPTFQNLVDVLEEFADTMAFRTGGKSGLLKAVECNGVCTVVYSSGLQVSGVVAGFETTAENEITFIKTSGATALAFANTQLPGHGKTYHKDGFSSPVGKLINSRRNLEDYTEDDLETAGIAKGKTTRLEFESGIVVNGDVAEILRKDDKLLLITFTRCTVTDKANNKLFVPGWGNYDMAVGNKIVAVFCGAADKDTYNESTAMPKSIKQERRYSAGELKYHQLFATVRKCREEGSSLDKLERTWHKLQQHYTDDWLCALEILEIVNQHFPLSEIAAEIRDYLEHKAATDAAYTKLIEDGLQLINQQAVQPDMEIAL